MDTSFSTQNLDMTALERGLDPFLRVVMPDKGKEIANLTTDQALVARIEELAEKSTEGELTDAERAEYEGYVRANKIVAIIQRYARKRLSQTHDSQTK